MKRWFEKSASFACSACGKCCKSSDNRVFINPREREAIAAVVGITTEAFDLNYTKDIIHSDGTKLTTLKMHPDKKQCIFLVGNKCSVYEARPVQCRTYPYWPQNMIGKAEWNAEANSCEGIKLRAKDGFVDEKEAGMNMIIHEIHNRGVGENWTYDEIFELLSDTINLKPEILWDYLDQFYDSNESKIGTLRQHVVEFYLNRITFVF